MKTSAKHFDRAVGP